MKIDGYSKHTHSLTHIHWHALAHPPTHPPTHTRFGEKEDEGESYRTRLRFLCLCDVVGALGNSLVR